MAGTISASMADILLACRQQLAAQIPIIGTNPALAICTAREVRTIPHFSAQMDVVLRAGSFLSQAPGFDGAGRFGTRFQRYLEVWPRIQSVSDPSNTDQFALTDQSLGYLRWEEQVLACLSGFWPMDASQNPMTFEELRIATGQQAVKGTDVHTRDWTGTGTLFEVGYFFSFQGVPWSPPLITTLDSLSTTRGATYSQTIGVVGGTPPYTWAQTGTLPPGLAFSQGVLSGTIPSGSSADPTGIYIFTVICTDANGQKAVQTYHMPVASLSPATISNPVHGVAYSQAISLLGGFVVGLWIATGLPPGLTMPANSNTISGTPTAPGGPYYVRVTYTVVPNIVVASANFVIAVT